VAIVLAQEIFPTADPAAYFALSVTTATIEVCAYLLSGTSAKLTLAKWNPEIEVWTLIKDATFFVKASYGEGIENPAPAETFLWPAQEAASYCVVREDGDGVARCSLRSLVSPPLGYPPTSHASAHGQGGADPVALNASQINAGTLARERGGLGVNAETVSPHRWLIGPASGSSDGPATFRVPVSADFGNQILRFGNRAATRSTLQTGDGTEQTLAHGLGSVPTVVRIEVRGAPNSAWSISEGTHDGTNTKITATTGVTYFVECEL